MKIVYMGTPDFAVPCLESIIKSENNNVIGVVTQPDKPKGRGHKLQPTPVKAKAVEYNIPVFQPETLKNRSFEDELKQLNPDIIVVVAYGQILPEYILNFPKFGCINVHASLLPKYRGAAPIQWSVINGDTTTGVTTMYMAKGLDSGDMILKAEEKIKDDDTYGTLYDRLSYIGADLLIKTLDLIERGEVVRVPQNDDDATLAPMITRDMEHIDWNNTSENVVNLIKGLNPQPVSYTMYNDEKLKIWFAEVEKTEYSGEIGEIVDVRKKDFVVKTKKGAVAVKEVQAQGGKKMTADAYMRGHTIEKGIILK